MQNTILGYLLAAVFLSAGAAQAMTYVVDNANPVAADTNPGSKDAPLKTISAAAKKVQPGDEVVVRPGIYREAVTVAVSGEEDNPIVFRSEEPGKAVICGSDILSEWQPEGPGVWSAAVGKTHVVDHLGHLRRSRKEPK
ncbi:MAG: chondroitinase-B domain-containing protein, partial [Terrimicrobiaceae bacterium]